jgi:hypothetical protein
MADYQILENQKTGEITYVVPPIYDMQGNPSVKLIDIVALYLAEEKIRKAGKR